MLELGGNLALLAAALLQSASVDRALGAQNDLLSLVTFPSQPAKDEQGNVIGSLFAIPQAAAPCTTRLNIMFQDSSGKQQLGGVREINWRSITGFTSNPDSGTVTFQYEGGAFQIGAPATKQALLSRIAPVLIGTCNPASGLGDPNNSPLTDGCPGSAVEAEALLAQGAKRDEVQYFASTVPMTLGGDRPISLRYERSSGTPQVKTLSLRLARPVSAYASAVRLQYQGWTQNRYADACKAGQTCVFEVGNEQGQPVAGFLSVDLKPAGSGAELACRYRG